MLSDEWKSRYGLLENFNASVTRTRTGTVTGTWTTGVTAIALCTSCSRANKMIEYFAYNTHSNASLPKALLSTHQWFGLSVFIYMCQLKSNYYLPIINLSTVYKPRAKKCAQSTGWFREACPRTVRLPYMA